MTAPVTRALLATVLLAPVGGTGCSVRSLATAALADTFAASGSGYGADEDPELVAGAVPFALKTMEQLLPEQPRHVGLHTALARGFTQYGYAFVQQEADRVMEQDLARGKEIETRARKLFLRARGYGLRGLAIAHRGVGEILLAGSPAARATVLATMQRSDVPLLYWSAAAWALAISAGKEDMKLVGDLPAVESMMSRALALDEAWGEGAIHEFFVAYDAGRSASEGGGPASAKQHLDRALALAQNKHLGVIVSYAEAVTVAAQDKAEFTRLLEGVLATDLDRFPEERLANLVAQRRSRWLLGRAGDLFAQ